MKNTQAIHSFGNGRFLIYGQGPDIISMYAGDYSSPSVAGLRLDNPTGYDDPERRLGTFTCTARTDTGSARFEDTLDPGSDTFVRKVISDAEMSFSVVCHPRAVTNTHGDAYTVILPKGTVYFTDVVTAREYRVYITCSGCASADGVNGKIHIKPGRGLITVRALRLESGRETPPDAGIDPNRVAADSDRYWANFFSRITRYPGIADTEESVAYTIKTQQSRDGGVVAGHFYPMAYVRDQAGTARGLLKLGLIPEARRIVEFWYGKFSRYGDLHNAETMGNEDGRLVFSNDEVEVPAYVIMTAFFCARADGDFEWLRGLKPMLSYAAKVQARQAARGMTGFSGDETYIAGSMFPRWFLYHGSAESTMMLILSLTEYIGYFGDGDDLSDTLNEAESRFRENFIIGGKLYANQPAREAYATLPRFQFGFCDTCIYHGKPAPLTWLERRSDGMYACPRCFNLPVTTVPEKVPMLLSSVSLSVFWHGFDGLTPEEKRETVRPFLEAFERRGNVYSSPDGDVATGYDYAYLLEALVATDSPHVGEVLDKTLEVLDESGSWSEYYRNGVPYNCRNRPWESAINIAACIDAVKALDARSRAQNG